ncbi:MAG: hypothetical protein ACE5D3_05825 [Candidatus Binatia bacterium]
MKLRNAITSITAAGLVAASMSVGAATSDGSLGSTSTGTQDISLTIQDLVQVSGIAAIDLGTYGGSGNASGSDTMCVYRNGTGSYSVTLTSANESSGAFRLNAGTDYITYSVTWDDTSGPSAVSSSTALTGQSGDSSSQTCNSVDNATVAVSATAAALQAAPTGSYSDVITILVSPT